jgi:hypothetical protein
MAMKLEYLAGQDSRHIGRNVVPLFAIMERQFQIFFDGQLNIKCMDFSLFTLYWKVASFEICYIINLLQEHRRIICLFLHFIF